MFRRIPLHRVPPILRPSAGRSTRRPLRLRLVALALSVPLLGAVGASAAGAASTVTAQSPNPGDESGSSASANYSGPVSSANARFIVDGYATLLGREADTGGLDFHLARLTAGGSRSRQAFTYSLLFSVEGSRGEVARAYGDLLDRSPDDAGRTYWTNHLQGHGVLDLRVLLLASDEYRNRAGGADQAWIEAVYADVLGRGADASGLAYWLERAGAGIPRALIAASIYQSDEAMARRSIAHYTEVLSRTPSAAERQGAAATIRRVGERGLRAELLASDENFERYLQAALS